MEGFRESENRSAAYGCVHCSAWIALGWKWFSLSLSSSHCEAECCKRRNLGETSSLTQDAGRWNHVPQ